MYRRLALAAGLCALFSARFALAQGADVTIGYQGLPHKAAQDTPNGIQISDGLLLHLGAGVEAGYDTNVFYQNSGTTGSGIIRTSAYAQLTNATRTGPTSGNLSFGAAVGLSYRHYTSDNPDLDQYRNAVMPNASLSVGASSGEISFSLSDNFVRIEDAPYNPGQLPFIRNDNIASVDGRWSPGGGVSPPRFDTAIPSMSSTTRI